MPSLLARLTVFAALVSLVGCESGGAPEGADAGLPAVDAGASERDAGPPPPTGETGRMVGMTEAHNRLRAMVPTATPLPPLTWSVELADTAQAWAERLAATGCDLMHSTNGYGENLYWQSGFMVTPEDVVQGWYDEVACYTFGPFLDGDACDAACIAAQNSNGCGHYTQVVWRDTLRVGCGMATCASGAEIWACNYDPPGNYLGQLPY